MRLLALAVVAATLVAPAARAADGETCQGRPATIVQATGSVNGTDGDDVIVGGSRTKVHAGAGDDTVCVAGGLVEGDEGIDSVEVRGTDEAERVVLSYVEAMDVETGPGPDRVRLMVDSDVPLRGSLDGGSGEDIVSVVNDETVTVNLAKARLVLRPRQRVALEGFENAKLDTFSIASRIVGDAGDNRLTLVSNYDCGGVARGGAGDDVISAGRTGVHETCFGIRAYGDAGDDVLIGSAYDDVLIGGPGRDRAFGGDDEGNDRCRAEVRRGCESR